MTKTKAVRILFFAMAATMAVAHGSGGSHHGNGWTSCSNERSGCSPRRHRHHNRNYNYSRRPRDAIDLVSDIFSIPFYTSANSLFRQQQHGSDGTLEAGTFAPRYAMAETEDGMVELTMEVPGVAAEDISVEVEDGHILRIHGSRTMRAGGSHFENYEFDQSFALDREIDLENISVTLSSGILIVSAPKRVPLTKRIPISVKEVLLEPKKEASKNVDAIEAGTTLANEGDDIDNVQASVNEQDGLEISEEETSWE